MRDPSENSCEECKWWDRRGDRPERGECHRNSPLPIHGESKVAAWWPVTDDFEWCGDFEAKEKANPEGSPPTVRQGGWVK